MNPRISIVIGTLQTGGAERVMINLANGFVEKQIDCSLVVLDDTGPMRAMVSPDVKVVNLKVDRARDGVGAFRKFLQKENPDAIIVSQTHVQLMALLAVKLEGWKGKVILNEHSIFSQNNKSIINKGAAKLLFGRADAITAVSKAVADDFIENFQSLKEKVSVIHNAGYFSGILELKEEANNLDTSLPVVLTTGRLTASKNYKLLIDAFAIVVKKQKARLVFLGDGKAKDELVIYADHKGITSNVIFGGVVKNPYSFMAKSKVFVLTSVYEGLPTVLIEALACCCNIVSTDSKGGTREILLDGKYGKIVPFKSDDLAKAILDSMEEQTDCTTKLERAKEFSAGVAAEKYISLVKKLW